MYTSHYRLDACPLGDDRHLVTSPDFPGSFLEVSAPDADEAMARARPWLIGCVIAGFKDG